MTDFILALPILLFGMVAHEYARGIAALRMGDDTGYLLGRLTLNPLVHLDPFMSLLLPAFLWWKFGILFGAARTLPVVPRKYRNFVRGDLLVSSAGIAVNLILVPICALGLVALGLLGRAVPAWAEDLTTLQRMVMLGVWANLGMAMINLVPLPPLDGARLLYHALPAGWGLRFRQLGSLGYLPLLVLLLFLPSVLTLLLVPAEWLGTALSAWIAPFGLGSAWTIFPRG